MEASNNSTIYISRTLVRTLHPSQSFFTLLLTFMPLANPNSPCPSLSSPGLLLSFPSNPADHRHTDDTDAPFSNHLALEVLNAFRSLHAAHGIELPRSEAGVRRFGRCGVFEMLRRVLRAAIARRGWSMVGWFLLCLFDQEQSMVFKTLE